MNINKIETKDDLHLKIPDLKIIKSIFKRQAILLNLGVMLDKSISCKYHVKTAESRLSKKHWFIMQGQTIT